MILLYEKNSDQRIAPASTTKMLTALTVLDCCDEEETVLVGWEIHRIAKDSSTASLHIGNRLTVHHLLDALLLPEAIPCGRTKILTLGSADAFSI